MAFEPGQIPDSLRTAYGQGRCAVLVGAGASAGAGLPLWGALLEQMITEGVSHQVIRTNKAIEYRKLLANSAKYLMVASGVKEDIRSYFDEFIQRVFKDSKRQPTDLHKALASLDKLQFVLTTNYDTLLERQYRQSDPDVSVCTFRDVGEIQRRLSKREFFILKAHGDAANPGNGVILTELDYRNLLLHHRAYQSLVSTMFTMFTMVFVGASMTDPEVVLLLRYIADAFAPESGPRHFTLMAEEETTQVERDRWYKDFGVQVIPISKADNYADLTGFLVALKESTSL